MSKAPKKGTAPEEAREEPLTAILMADSFTTKFRPVTMEQPKVLLPIANACLIDYTLEWLTSQSVRVVHVICCAHADAVKQYLCESKWVTCPEMELRFVLSYNCRSIAEALRLVDSKGVIKDDFVLVTGDTVTNMNLERALTAHRERRAKDKNAIMTIVMAPRRQPLERMRLGINDLVVALDPTTKRLLSYTNYEDGTKTGDTVSPEATFFSERDRVQLECHLQDTEIYICAPEVLMLFSDNFDYQLMRRDFITGVLSEEELGNKLYVHELENEYATRVYNFRTYDAVSRDILMRWVHPKVPDSNLFPAPLADTYGPSSYTFSGDYRYRERGVAVARTATIGPGTCIGAGTLIGSNAVVERAVLGRGCRVGEACTIERSYIMSNVTIMDGAVIKDAFICDGAVIGARAIVSGGCIISYGCRIGDGHTVPPFARITAFEAPLDLSEDSEFETEDVGRNQDQSSAGMARTGSNFSTAFSGGLSDRLLSGGSGTHAPRSPPAGPSQPHDAEAVGAGGVGYNYYRQQRLPAGEPYEMLTSVLLPSAVVADARVQRLTAHGDTARGPAEGEPAADDASDDDGDEDAGLLDDPERVFKREVTETLLRSMYLVDTTESTKASAKKDFHENVVIELNSLKIAEVRTFADCARYALTAILDLAKPPSARIPALYRYLFRDAAPDVASKAGAAALLADMRANLKNWASLLQRFLREEEDQVEVLVTLEEYCGGEGTFEGPDSGALYTPFFGHLLMELYENDIVGEDAFLEWERAKVADDPEDQVFLRKADKFLEWLKSAEDEEDSDEGSEEASDTEGDSGDTNDSG